ncbi:MAG TPA: TetR/AcrR family transcriptional regulator [Actinomycetota bacterium]|jgi:AcrR family transcriptional regulator|nr:TetR/AcrR family transcriptional regulator [Actinomycetota bacterium]
MSPRRKLSDARRRQILKAAVQVIASKGLCDTGIKDVADQAGTSPALVIYYFGTKDALLAEALAFADERFYAQTAEAVAGMASARDRLVELVRCSCSLGEADDDFDEWVLWLDLWARAAHKPDVARDRQTMDRRWRTTIGEIVRQGQAAGEFAPVDAAAFALRLAALIDGLAVLVVLKDPDVTRERMFDLCMETCASELGFSWTTGDRAALTAPRRAAASG